MRDFITAALPLVLLGLAIALFAASAGQEPTQEPEQQRQNMLVGLALGLILGAVLNGCGLIANHTLGLALCALLGMAGGTWIST